MLTEGPPESRVRELLVQDEAAQPVVNGTGFATGCWVETFAAIKKHVSPPGKQFPSPTALVELTKTL